MAASINLIEAFQELRMQKTLIVHDDESGGRCIRDPAAGKIWQR